MTPDVNTAEVLLPCFDKPLASNTISANHWIHGNKAINGFSSLHCTSYKNPIHLMLKLYYCGLVDFILSSWRDGNGNVIHSSSTAYCG